LSARSAQHNVAGKPAAVIVPGYGADTSQPIVRACAAQFEAVGIAARPIAFSRARPAGDYAPELDELRRARQALQDAGARAVALVGRSFGARMCARLAAEASPAALVLLGHPIAPRNRPRPEDEAALAVVRCPTLVVQGDRDALGPLSVLRRIAADNPAIELHVLPNTGHQFGPKQAEAVAFATTWLLRQVTAS
jgi:predicted alpha/beta-hydrolase family hydrolase